MGRHYDLYTKEFERGQELVGNPADPTGFMCGPNGINQNATEKQIVKMKCETCGHEWAACNCGRKLQYNQYTDEPLNPHEIETRADNRYGECPHHTSRVGGEDETV